MTPKVSTLNIHPDIDKLRGMAPSLAVTKSKSVLITQGDQSPEVEMISSLAILGYNQGSKGVLNAKLKKVLQKTMKHSSSRNIPQVKKEEVKNNDLDGDQSSQLDDEQDKDFDTESLNYLKDILSTEVAPKIVYIPEAKVMRRLILRNI